jgi:ATP-binding cassette subfamily F protein uup
MGRVRALKELRNERAARRNVVGQARAQIQDAERSGRLVLRAKDLTFAYGETRIVDGLNFELMRGDRVALVGPNGAGKSTLIRLLLGELEPDRGEAYAGTKLEVARFDQLHDTLNPARSVAENVAGAADMIEVGGKQRHVISYLSDFLFSADQARGKITKLSGGERNRLQLAAILARPCNLLVLDEPTNDLDLETLELLEELLSEYQGTLLLVSHDRAFIENVVTSVLAWEAPGVWQEYLGGYDDWQRGLAERQAAAKAAKARQEDQAKRAKQAGTPKPNAPEPKARKLTFTEAHELKRLPDAIEALDATKESLLARMATPDYYKSPQATQAKDRSELARLEAELETKMARWEELEGLAK